MKTRSFLTRRSLAALAAAPLAAHRPRGGQNETPQPDPRLLHAVRTVRQTPVARNVSPAFRFIP